VAKEMVFEALQQKSVPADRWKSRAGIETPFEAAMEMERTHAKMRQDPTSRQQWKSLSSG